MNITTETIVAIAIFQSLIAQQTHPKNKSLVEDGGEDTTKRDVGGQATSGGGGGYDSHANGNDEHPCDPENMSVIIK